MHWDVSAPWVAVPVAELQLDIDEWPTVDLWETRGIVEVDVPP